MAQVNSATDGNRYLGSFATEIEAAAEAAAYRREHMPYAVEDDALCDLVRTRLPKQREMDVSTALAIRIARATTTISYRKIAEMFGVTAGAAQAVICGRTFKLGSFHA